MKRQVERIEIEPGYFIVSSPGNSGSRNYLREQAMKFVAEAKAEVRLARQEAVKLAAAAPASPTKVARAKVKRSRAR